MAQAAAVAKPPAPPRRRRDRPADQLNKAQADRVGKGSSVTSAGNKHDDRRDGELTAGAKKYIDRITALAGTGVMRVDSL
ncbi:hypothetical protein AB5L52_33180 [Streptomyces sp. CG4]|uniref:hypothetical protein n=1 Tax=unclassified Streptomyces TaxID=2593676 RepID=UPI0033263014